MSLPNNTNFRPQRNTLNNFYVDWDRRSQLWARVKRSWTPRERPPNPRLASFMTWRMARGGGVIEDVGARFRDLWIAKLDVGNDDEWRFGHPLGRGGYGAVALFERTDRLTQALTDQVAIKTTAARDRDAVDRGLNLAKEAALMAQTNDIDADGMLALREYKFYQQDAQWKYYLEYCPYGDLERLRMRYKAYGRYLPEAFLWHLFYWLASTANEYSTANIWSNIQTNAWGQDVPGGFLLHSDIKPQNIMLGPQDPNVSTDVDLYPTPRVSDLGMAEIQSLRNRNNKAAHLTKGTTHWWPPEIRYAKLNLSTDFYPFGRLPLNPGPVQDRYLKGRHQISSAANVWAMGAVMFGMTSLQEASRMSDILDNILQEVYPPPAPGDSIVEDEDFHILPGQLYSMALTDLIKDCMKLTPSDRPSEEDLVDRVLAGWDHWRHQIDQRAAAQGVTAEEIVETDPEFKVYYRANEIDQAPDNDQFNHPGRDMDWWTYRFVYDMPFLIPEWGRLWPAAMPSNVTPPMGWPRDWATAFFNLQRLENQDASRAAAAAGNGGNGGNGGGNGGAQDGAQGGAQGGNAAGGNQQHHQHTPHPGNIPNIGNGRNAGNGGNAGTRGNVRNQTQQDLLQFLQAREQRLQQQQQQQQLLPATLPDSQVFSMQGQDLQQVQADMNAGIPINVFRRRTAADGPPNPRHDAFYQDLRAYQLVVLNNRQQQQQQQQPPQPQPQPQQPQQQQPQQTQQPPRREMSAGTQAILRAQLNQQAQQRAGQAPTRGSSTRRGVGPRPARPAQGLGPQRNAIADQNRSRYAPYNIARRGGGREN